MTPRRLQQVQLYANPRELDKLRFLRAYADAVAAFRASLAAFGEQLSQLEAKTQGRGTA